MRRREFLGRIEAMLLASLCTSKSTAASERLDQSEFRRLGGKVVAFMYGGWQAAGPVQNPSPWYWINRYAPDRIPVASEPIEGHMLHWELEYAGPSSYAAQPALAAAAHASPFLPASDQWLLLESDSLTIASSPVQLHYSTQEFRGVQLQLQLKSGALADARLELVIADINGGTTGPRKIGASTFSFSQGILNLEFAPDPQEAGPSLILGWKATLLFSGNASYSLSKSVGIIPTKDYRKTLLNLVGLPSGADSTSVKYLRDAERAGIDAFLLCVFWNGIQSRNQDTVESMVRCSQDSRTKTGFYIDTSASSPLNTLEELEHFALFVCRYMRSTGYWFHAGRPVLGFSGSDTLVKFFANCRGIVGSNPTDRCRNGLALLRDRCKQALPNFTEPLFVTGNMADHPSLVGNRGGPALLEYLGFDAGTSYNQFHTFEGRSFGHMLQDDGRTRLIGDVKSKWPGTMADMTFSEVDEVYRRAASWIIEESGNLMAYWIPVIAGWDDRPWSFAVDMSRSPCTVGKGCEPSGVQFKSHLQWASKTAVALAQRSKSPPIVCAYAWDEFGEGGILCPVVGETYSKLDALKHVFGSRIYGF